MNIDQRVSTRLTKIMVCGCTCETKTPDIKYHKDWCIYKNAVEIYFLLETGNLPEDNEDNNSGNG